MKRVHRAWVLGTVGLLTVLLLVAGCYRPAPAPQSPSAEAEEEALPSDEAIIATARAKATAGAQTATAEAAPAEEEPEESAPSEETPSEEQAEEPEQPAEEPESAAPTAVQEQATAVPAAEATTAPQPTAATGGTTHTVRAGETLFSISTLYGVTVQAVMAANNLTGTTIYVGQVLVIPAAGEQPPASPGAATTYTVKAGDNLYRIALAFGLTYQQLAAYNGIANPDDIYAGQVLKIPPR